ncbi:MULTISPECIES: spermidine synthase [Pseudomonas]|uniref:spermidine synthase n=1 Tax=Pseudomonas TaxID=286 RepID=UPI0002E2E2E1|nr:MULTISPECIES: spermidine synthase [Pseudomonas]MCD4863656.1 spermidine synthase [Pseudomonas sp. PLB05]MDC7827798.1 spermidine synthase [Pseudomonas benzopyrenica]NRH41301.1 spermidine synthase [Pseudomonas sp. MS15a(2019)]SEO86111.1 Spermidine synthase [Pseudomonas sp. Snoq117.2]
MVETEVLLEEVVDDHGRIRVVEVGPYRFLEFGEEVEQSCVFTTDPAWLEYDYNRAMLLGALCHPQPQRALFLGLGAGTLTQACLKWLPLEAVEALELRPAVPRLARQHLGLGEDPRLQIRIGDALELLDSAAPADLIFVDLYTDVGPSSAHLAWRFLENCQAKLNPGGWLMINQWSATDGKPLGAALLRGLFRHHYWECPVVEGNVILLVPASLEQELDEAGTRQRVRELSLRIGFDLEAYLNNLRAAT